MKVISTEVFPFVLIYVLIIPILYVLVAEQRPTSTNFWDLSRVIQVDEYSLETGDDSAVRKA